jgi:DHA1 family bicyclomycin/chloramphenicol resistance-like MFS transporter
VVRWLVAHEQLRFLLALGALIGMAPMSIDMYLPSLPTIQAEFGAEPGAVQFTLAAFFVGLAVGQAVSTRGHTRRSVP